MNKVILTLLLSLPLAACAGKLQTNCDVVPAQKTVKQGEIFSLKLPANPTTGYGWIIRALPAQVALTGMEYAQSPDCQAGMTGCSGQTTLYLKAVTAGKGDLKLQYARPWESLLDGEVNTTAIVVNP